jgi:hypothetical protein
MTHFRALVYRVQNVAGNLHRHVHLLVKRGDDWAVCGVMVLHSAEWEQFGLICEVTSIGVIDEPTEVSTDKPKAAPAE